MKDIIWGIIHGEGTILCECDECGNSYEYEFEDGYLDFKDCQETIKGLGWLSRRVNNTWYDFCCVECHKKFIAKKNKWEAVEIWNF